MENKDSIFPEFPLGCTSMIQNSLLDATKYVLCAFCLYLKMKRKMENKKEMFFFPTLVNLAG